MIGILFWLCVLGFFYIYAGYPLVLALLARLRLKPRPYSPYFPTVTLLIAAYNEQEVIAAKLENSLSLDYPSDSLQILVAADGSDDHTADIVRSFAERGVDLNYEPARRGKMAAINRAMPLVRGEIIVFSDANNFYEPQTLRELVKPFAEARVGAAAGSKRVLAEGSALGEADSLYWRYESFIKKQETRLGSCTGVSGEVFAIRRNLFTPPPAAVINDDFFLALSILRSGYRIVYVPEACSREPVAPDEQAEIVRRTRIIAGRYQILGMSLGKLPYNKPLLVWQIVSHKFMRPLAPFFMLGAMLTSLASLIWVSSPGIFPLLSLAPPYHWIILGLQVIFYFAAWLGKHLKVKGILGKLLYLPTFLFNSNYAALLGLVGYLTGRNSVVWQKAPRRGYNSDVSR
jgi:cellulose synthase/poly-beta-1,6-N-acetylglucosamine synthase-like glycosyltransferase